MTAGVCVGALQLKQHRFLSDKTAGASATAMGLSIGFPTEILRLRMVFSGPECNAMLRLGLSLRCGCNLPSLDPLASDHRLVLDSSGYTSDAVAKSRELERDGLLWDKTERVFPLGACCISADAMTSARSGRHCVRLRE